ncbi:MAG: hypothetical protein IKS41_03935 [Alphaproteobacteria bacterium]|nr:hypothetical protein [Alphaproteobacteria bacterium]
MNIKKIALTAGLAGTLSGCCGYYATGTYVAPATATYVAPTVATPAVVTTPAVVAPVVVTPAYRSWGWNPYFHHHHYWRYRW